VIFSLALLWLSNRIAKQFPGPFVGIATVLLLPWVLLIIAIAIGQGILNVQADNGGAAVAAVTTSIVAFGGLLLSRVSGERRILLEALQARIDHSLVVLLARQESRRESEQELGVFLHHSIQSELSALALQLGVAANSADAQLRVDARAAALERLIRIQETTPPWSTSTPGPDRIHEVVKSWEGIASIDVSLPPTEEGRPDQWKLVSQAVEESIANSIRAGHADRIRIKITTGTGSLLLEVADNGHESVEPAHREPGLGTAWLNSVAPGMWSLQRGESGSTLRVEFL
jgi:signal transduction histidine kinase